MRINIPTDFHSMIFQRGRYTTNQILIGILSPWVENHQPEYYVHRFSIKKAPGILTHTWFPGCPDHGWCFCPLVPPFWTIAVILIHISGSILTTEPCSPEAWNNFLRIRGIIPIWSGDSGEWNMIIYPEIWQKILLRWLNPRFLLGKNGEIFALRYTGLGPFPSTPHVWCSLW